MSQSSIKLLIKFGVNPMKIEKIMNKFHFGRHLEYNLKYMGFQKIEKTYCLHL